jgi:hypothetical protein
MGIASELACKFREMWGKHIMQNILYFFTRLSFSVQLQTTMSKWSGGFSLQPCWFINKEQWTKVTKTCRANHCQKSALIYRVYIWMKNTLSETHFQLCRRFYCCLKKLHLQNRHRWSCIIDFWSLISKCKTNIIMK